MLVCVLRLINIVVVVSRYIVYHPDRPLLSAARYAVRTEVVRRDRRFVGERSRL